MIDFDPVLALLFRSMLDMVIVSTEKISVMVYRTYIAVRIILLVEPEAAVLMHRMVVADSHSDDSAAVVPMRT